MRTIAAVTSSRADFGILTPVLREIASRPALELKLYVTGMHASPRFADALAEIEASGFPVAAKIGAIPGDDSPAAIGEALGRSTAAFARELATQPDILLVLGDRFDMFAAVLGALPHGIPVAHLHGGESSFGVIDEQIRHAITKLAHLHFVATAEYARRVVQMGEAPWRVHVSGAPALDAIANFTYPAFDKLSKRIGFDCASRFVLVTFHPETLAGMPPLAQIEELLGALAGLDLPIVITGSNTDSGGAAIDAALRQFCATASNRAYVAHLGVELYYTAMRAAAVMVGNSSSGIIEAASFGLPVVNIGRRQDGRVRQPNIVDAPLTRAEIANALRQALAPEFRAALGNHANVYGDGHAARRIADVLEQQPLGPELVVKKFHDMKVPE
ncbi:MAG: UDP-N-acetylglucosamine 2-epimerase [Proteobacteria bacterium]|nr:UDP-N-acetylglucosamine 2-epimerase [Pseudomonadota bacterium]